MIHIEILEIYHKLDSALHSILARLTYDDNLFDPGKFLLHNVPDIYHHRNFLQRQYRRTY